jgi:hypothetical protein
MHHLSLGHFNLAPTSCNDTLFSSCSAAELFSIPFVYCVVRGRLLLFYSGCVSCHHNSICISKSPASWPIKLQRWGRCQIQASIQFICLSTLPRKTHYVKKVAPIPFALTQSYFSEGDLSAHIPKSFNSAARDSKYFFNHRGDAFVC